MVASAPIAAGESVRVFYGDSYAPHRSWEVAEPAEHPIVDKHDLVAFLDEHCHLELGDITHMCLGRHPKHHYTTVPKLPIELPRTIVID